MTHIINYEFKQLFERLKQAELLKRILILFADSKQIVRKRGLEPLRPNGHYPLKVACIPISPLPQKTEPKISEKITKRKRVLTGSGSFIFIVLVLDHGSSMFRGFPF